MLLNKWLEIDNAGDKLDQTSMLDSLSKRAFIISLLWIIT